MKITATFQTENAAFEDNGINEYGHIMTQIYERADTDQTPGTFPLLEREHGRKRKGFQVGPIPMKHALRLAMLLLIWTAVALIFCLEGCRMGYTEKTQQNASWAAAWACRCDTCCQILDELEAERLDAVEGSQL
jgi:hypothetical protein